MSRVSEKTSSTLLTQSSWRADLVAVVVLIMTGLAALWPLALFGYPQHTDDARYHSTWAMHFLNEVSAGNLYPRWLPAMNDGLGSPIFFFYGPVSFWLTSLTARFVVPSTPFVPLAIVSAFMLVSSGIAAFFWLRALVHGRPALVGAVLYMVLPYHLTIDLWTRSAFAEFNGFVWTPFLFLGIERIRAGRPAGLLLLSLAFALLVMTHIISAMLIALMAATYAVARLRGSAAFITATAAAALGLALAAVYLATAVGLKDLAVHAVGVIDRQWFLPVITEHPRSRFMFMITADVGAESIFAIAMLLSTVLMPTHSGRGLVITWASLTILTLLGTTVLTEPLWNRIPLLQNAQFPFRILGFADLGTATLAALAIGRISARVQHPGMATAVTVAIITLAGAVQGAVAVKLGAFRPGDPAWTEHFATQGDDGFFRPLESVNKLSADSDPPLHISTEIIQVVHGAATLQLVGHSGNRYAFDVEAGGPAAVRLGQLYFAGWSARANNVGLQLHADAQGLVEARIPAGHYILEFWLAPTIFEQCGLAVSGIGAAIWLLSAARTLIQEMRRERQLSISRRESIS